MIGQISPFTPANGQRHVMSLGNVAKFRIVFIHTLYRITHINLLINLHFSTNRNAMNGKDQIPRP